MYQILPFVAAANLALPELPVELWSIVLRCLDPSSLLTAVRTHPLWSNISRGDPVLRRTVQEQVLLERRRHQDEIMNPGLLYTITRDQPAQLFGTNRPKIVTRRLPTQVQEVPRGFERRERTNKSKNKVGGPIKNKLVDSRPRRSMRC